MHDSMLHGGGARRLTKSSRSRRHSPVRQAGSDVHGVCSPSAPISARAADSCRSACYQTGSSTWGWTSRGPLTVSRPRSRSYAVLDELAAALCSTTSSVFAPVLSLTISTRRPPLAFTPAWRTSTTPTTRGAAVAAITAWASQPAPYYAMGSPKCAIRNAIRNRALTFVYYDTQYAIRNHAHGQSRNTQSFLCLSKYAGAYAGRKYAA